MGISRITSSIVTFTLYGSAKEKRKKKAQNLSDEITAENVPNLGKETDIQVQAAQKVPNRKNPKSLISVYIIIKMATIRESLKDPKWPEKN